MSEHTAGPWHWVSPDTDIPWDGVSELDDHWSLRTVEKFGKDETVVRDGKSYTSWALPKAIVSNAETILTEADARLIAASPESIEMVRRAFEIIDPVAYPHWTKDALDLFAKIDGVAPPRPVEMKGEADA